MINEAVTHSNSSMAVMAGDWVMLIGAGAFLALMTAGVLLKFGSRRWNW